MVSSDDDDTIEPGNGRILGAGSNNLQRSLDTLNTSVQRLITANSGGMGGGGGMRPPPRAIGGPSPEPSRPSSSTAPRGDRFPVPVSWNSNDSRTDVTYEWGTPTRNAAPIIHSANQQALPAPLTGFQWAHQTSNSTFAKGNPDGPTPPNIRRMTSTARRWVGRIQNFGNAQLKMALPMDNYAQWAAIQAGSPIGADGTNGSGVNNIRKFMFGSQGRNQIMWAQNAQDASNAAFIASRDSGFSPLAAGSTSQINPAFANYMGGIKDLSMLNPMMNAADTANVMGTLTGIRGLYSSMMFGYRPVLGQGGKVDRNALGGFADSVMRTAYGKTSVASRNLTAGLGQNGVLNANIQAYVNAAGGDQKTVQALEDYITGRNTAMQRGLSGDQFDQLLKTYEAGGSGASAAGSRLKKLGISNSILQSQKDLGAAKAENTSDLLDSFGPAIKKANDALGDFYGVLDKIVNIPGLKQIVGYTGAFGSVFGGATSTIIGGVGGYAASRYASGALTGALTRGATTAGARTTLGSAASSLSTSTLALGGAAVFLAAGAGGQHWSKEEAKQKAFEQWEKETNGVKDIRKLKGKQFLADNKKFDAIWAQAQKDQAAGRTTGNDGIGGGSLATVTGGSGKAGGSGSPSSGNVVNGKSAAGAISAALAEVGKPYQWGGTGPDSWDCSGLMQHAYGTIGVRLPRTSEQQMTVGQGVDQKDVRPGDLMFPYAGHVVMYIGGGKIVEAPRTGENVRTASVNEYGRYVAIRRIVGSVGNLGAIDTGGKSAPKQMADNYGGDSGSQVMGAGSYGSVEEVDAIQSALSSAAAATSSVTQNSSAAKSGTTTAATSSGPWKKTGADVQRAKALGKQLASQLYNWTGAQWDALDKLWTGESGWQWWAENPSSHAYGIVQALPGSKMASVGKDWKTNPATQEKWGMKYIHDRYGDPVNAYATWSQRSPHWYNTGAWNIPDDQIAMVHKGEMIIERPKADTIRNALMSDVVNVKNPSSGSASKSGSQGLTLLFDKHSISFNISGSMSEAQAEAAGTAFVRAVASDDRLKALARGQ